MECAGGPGAPSQNSILVAVDKLGYKKLVGCDFSTFIDAML